MSEKTLKTMKINVGPQHPSTHGVLRLILELDGEVIKSCEPKIGYLHRGMEKMAENMTYLQYLPVVDRIDYLSGFFCAEAYTSCVEKLAKIEVPQRAKYIRTLLMELNRISSHVFWLGTFMLDLGATSPLFYCLRDREELLSLFEKTFGQRMMYNYHIFGGVKFDLQDEFLDSVQSFCERFPKKINEYENIITNNPIFTSRTKKIGILTRKTAIQYSITGVNLRATGVNFDLRRKRPYLIYDELDFGVPTSKEKDSYSRYLLRIAEMRECVKLAMQCVNWLKENKNLPTKTDKKLLTLKPEAGFAISMIEAPRGLMSCQIVSDGSDKPLRVKWRTPSFYSAQVLSEILKNHIYADVMAIFGSFDIILPEVDR